MNVFYLFNNYELLIKVKYFIKKIKNLQLFGVAFI